MGGCFKSIGCLVVAVAFATAAWFTRGYWTPYLREYTHASLPAHVRTPGTWQPATPAGAARARAIVDGLASRNGPVYGNVEPGDLIAFVFQQLSHQLPPSARDVQAMVSGDQLLVRASVNPSDLGDLSELGPLANMLGDREQVQFGGTLDIVKLGLAEYHVQSFSIHDFSIPHAMLPRLIKSYSKGARPAGVADDALPLITPVHIGDVRIKNSQITLYKVVR
ncbi:MAG TPA: hypothetical protein VK617_16405 [Gemmatimonadaceae bacterium]|jgi:hypothetical protein|nr:hypothetical protein [Gemmatimonadaceae bacterium]